MSHSWACGSFWVSARVFVRDVVCLYIHVYIQGVIHGSAGTPPFLAPRFLLHFA